MSMTDENLVIEDAVTPSEDNSLDNHDDKTELSTKELRHSQQMEGARKEVERKEKIAVEMAFKAAQADANNLLELHKEDPKLAAKVASKLNFTDSEWGSYENFIKGIKKGTLSGATLTEDDIERIVQEREAKKEHERSLKKAEKIINKLPEDLREAAQTRFDKLITGKMLDEDEATEIAEMATLYVSKDKIKEQKRDEGLASYGSSNVSKSATTSKSQPDFQPLEFDERGNLVLRSNK